MKKLSSVTGAIPYLLVVFLNAFVDLGHKITIQNTLFTIYDGSTQIILTAIVNGLILLPFIMLFSPAGFIGDRFPKNTVMKKAALAAVFLSIAITFCYYQGWFWAAFAMTFLLAMQSAIYSPAKYGYLKPLFGKEGLAQANGVVQSVTIAAILGGTLVFSLIFRQLIPEQVGGSGEVLQSIAPLGWLLVLNSLAELYFAHRLPQLEAGDEQKVFDTREYLKGQLVKKNIQPVLSNSVIRLSVIGLAMFWSIGQVMLATFPAFAKEQLGIVDPAVIQAVLAASAIGIALGSYFAARWSQKHIETGLIPIAALGVSLGLIALTLSESVAACFASFLFIGFMGGLFIVPLNALIQFHAKDHELAQVLAGNNLVQNLGMFGFLLLTVGFAMAGFSSVSLLVIVAIVAALGGIYTVYKLPQSLVRSLLTGILSRRYRVDVQGMKNLPGQGGVLLLGNHISFIDWAIVQIASPRPVRFVMLKSIYERWYLKWFFKLNGCVPIESGASSEDSLKTVAGLLDNGDVVCLFPEGIVSRTGHLGEFRRGFEKACRMTVNPMVIVPFYLRGLWGSQFSRSSEKLKSQRSEGIYRDLIVAFGEALPHDTAADVLKRRVFDLSITSWNAHAEGLPSIPAAWIDSVKRGKTDLSIADSNGRRLSYYQSLAMVLPYSKRILRLCRSQNVGIALPVSTDGMSVNMAVLLAGKTVVNVNYTSTGADIEAAVAQSEMDTLITSKEFVQTLKSRGINLKESLTSIKLLFVEDLKADVSRAEILRRSVQVALLPAAILKLLYCRKISPDSTAAISFSSGSEGQPKGVMLSHRNIMANVKQISDVLNTQSNDVVMASLPLFHAFGLTVTQFMPLVEGLPVVCHPDPSDSLGIARAVKRFNGTVMFGTSTFLKLFNDKPEIHPLMLSSLRLVVAGAERLDPSVKLEFERRFQTSVYEGYGATETTPVASVNLPDALDSQNWKIQKGQRDGTVGLPLPGTGFKIVDPETLNELDTGEEGMILIGGSQVMQGYLNDAERTRKVMCMIEGASWYITGDKGNLDADGFLTIVDRYSQLEINDVTGTEVEANAELAG